MQLCRQGTRRLRVTCSWPRSVQTRPSGTTSWQLAGTYWFHFWPSSCSSSCSSTLAHPRAPLTSLERTASKTSWNCLAGRLSRRERNKKKKKQLVSKSTKNFSQSNPSNKGGLAKICSALKWSKLVRKKSKPWFVYYKNILVGMHHY